MAHPAAQNHLLGFALVVAGLDLLERGLPAFDLLGVVDFLLCGQKLVLADGGQVLTNEIGGKASAVVGQLVAIAIRTRPGKGVTREALFGLLAVT